MKHTPGPWAAFIGNRGKTISIDIGPTAIGKRPCIINWSGFDDTDLPITQRVANARLIAAAPDLLEALQILLERASRNSIDPFALQQAVRAIAKATGESK